jgi:hypothetical protein
MVAAHAKPKPTNASVWTFIIAVLSAPSSAIASSGCWQHLWVIETNFFSLKEFRTVPAALRSRAPSVALVHRRDAVDAKPRRTIIATARFQPETDPSIG